MSPAVVRPFPWASLDSTTRGEAEATRGLRRWLGRYTQLDAVGGALGQLLGTEVEILFRRAQPAAEARSFDDAVGVVLSPAEAPRLQDGALVAFEHALAANAVARCLQRPAPRLPHPAAVTSPGVAGALGAVLAAAARRAHAGVALRVIAAGPARILEADLARLDPALVSATATVLVANEAYLARLVLPRRAIDAAPPLPCGRAELAAALGPVALPLPIVACWTRAQVADVGSLRAGDVWIPGTWPLRRGTNGELTGPVLLAGAGSEVGLRADLGEGGRVVLGGEAEALCAAEAKMGESGENSELIRAVGEVPVVVRVEIGEARMAAREWAALSRGDVVALGRRVGQPVILRVGGVPVARGELVEIDGEVGVRIVERLTGATP